MIWRISMRNGMMSFTCSTQAYEIFVTLDVIDDFVLQLEKHVEES